MSKYCYYFKFILFVTGQGEKEHLPKMFSSLSQSGICTFKVCEFVGQRRPITSPDRKVRMIRTGKKIPDKDLQKIGFPARKYIDEDRCNRVILIDDLEEDSKNEADEKFSRYRDAFDLALNDKKGRASVHFLVNMLEAYFFADPDALNKALKLEPPVDKYDGDVETIRHPKNRLKKIFSDYRETEHPGLILDSLNLDIVLENPQYCSSLRTCIKWIVDQLKNYPNSQELEALLEFEERFNLKIGELYRVTSNQ